MKPSCDWEIAIRTYLLSYGFKLKSVLFNQSINHAAGDMPYVSLKKNESQVQKNESLLMLFSYLFDVRLPPFGTTEFECSGSI